MFDVTVVKKINRSNLLSHDRIDLKNLADDEVYLFCPSCCDFDRSNFEDLNNDIIDIDRLSKHNIKLIICMCYECSGIDEELPQEEEIELDILYYDQYMHLIYSTLIYY